MFSVGREELLPTYCRFWPPKRKTCVTKPCQVAIDHRFILSVDVAHTSSRPQKDYMVLEGGERRFPAALNCSAVCVVRLQSSFLGFSTGRFSVFVAIIVSRCVRFILCSKFWCMHVGNRPTRANSTEFSAFPQKNFGGIRQDIQRALLKARTTP